MTLSRQCLQGQEVRVYMDTEDSQYLIPTSSYDATFLKNKFLSAFQITSLRQISEKQYFKGLSKETDYTSTFGNCCCFWYALLKLWQYQSDEAGRVLRNGAWGQFTMCSQSSLKLGRIKVVSDDVMDDWEQTFHKLFNPTACPSLHCTFPTALNEKYTQGTLKRNKINNGHDRNSYSRSISDVLSFKTWTKTSLWDAKVPINELKKKNT